MMHTPQGLYDYLNVTLGEINKQIDTIKKDVLQYTDDYDDVYHARHKDGTFVLTDLLIAKAQILNGMASLKAADLAAKAAPRTRR